jgi:carbonic anhydrase
MTLAEEVGVRLPPPRVAQGPIHHGRRSASGHRADARRESRSRDAGPENVPAEPVCQDRCVFDELLEANRAAAEGFALAGLPPAAAKGFGLVTCMDTRIEPLAMLGLRPGDAKILRNAGGRVTPDVLRSLVLATRLLSVRGIAVMQHTECALAGIGEEEVVERLEKSGTEAAASWEFLAMDDPDRALREDVERVRTCPLLPEGVAVEGWRYDVASGLIERIVGSEPPGA